MGLLLNTFPTWDQQVATQQETSSVSDMGQVSRGLAKATTGLGQLWG